MKSLGWIAVSAVAVWAVPALSEELAPEQARRFVAGKVFSYTCFEGTRGAGRINGDGSVSGTIQIRGSGPIRHVTLPANTIRVSSTSICAAVRGIAFQPCFKVDRTDTASFRGSVSGLRFAYCDFTRRNPRIELTGPAPRARPIAAAATPRPVERAVLTTAVEKAGAAPRTQPEPADE